MLHSRNNVGTINLFDYCVADNGKNEKIPDFTIMKDPQFLEYCIDSSKEWETTDQEKSQKDKIVKTSSRAKMPRTTSDRNNVQQIQTRLASQ